MHSCTVRAQETDACQCQNPSVRFRLISGNARADWMPSVRATFVKSALVAITALPVLNALPMKEPSTGCRSSSLANPLLPGKSMTRWRNWRFSASGNHTRTTSQCISCLMLVEIARMSSRDSRFDAKVFVMSSRNFRRSLSRCVSGLALGDSREFNGWSGVAKSPSLHSPTPSVAQIRTGIQSLLRYLVLPPSVDAWLSAVMAASESM